MPELLNLNWLLERGPVVMEAERNDPLQLRVLEYITSDLLSALAKILHRK